jgi:hypothetical protein
MSNLTNIFESFFRGDQPTIEEHKDAILKENANKYLNQGFDGIYDAIDSSDISKLMESFQTLVQGIDHYKSEETENFEKLLVEAIDSFTDETSSDDLVSIEYFAVKLQESLEQKGAKILLEEYENVESLETQLEEEMVSDPNPNPTESGQADPAMSGTGAESDTPTDAPQPAEAEPIADGTDADVEKVQESAFERGLEEGRKYYEQMRSEGLNPKNYARQLAETKYAERPFMEVETWMEGFAQGIKIQERILRETKPEMFESENEE